MPASRSAHRVARLLLTVTRRGRFCLKDPTPQTRTHRLRGSEGSPGTRGQEAVVLGPDSATPREQPSSLLHTGLPLHSTREHTARALLDPPTHAYAVCTHTRARLCTRGHAGLHVCTDTHVHASHSGAHSRQALTRRPRGTCVCNAHTQASASGRIYKAHMHR